jgi:dipeptidyl aminopeptidase/acylaminoacyl peptidase
VKKSYSVDDALSLQLPSSPAIAPDGSWTAWVERPICAGTAPTRLRLCSLDTGASSVVPDVEAPETPRWSPDSQRIAFVDSAADGSSRLLTAAPADPRPRLISETSGVFTAPQWRRAGAGAARGRRLERTCLGVRLCSGR